MKTKERRDESTPSQRRWLDRYAKTCLSRGGFIISRGSVVKRIRGGYGTIGDLDRIWEYVKNECVKFERNERRRVAREIEMNKGIDI